MGTTVCKYHKDPIIVPPQNADLHCVLC
jgi:hypothetical protein